MALRKTIRHPFSIHSTLFTTCNLLRTAKTTYRPTAVIILKKTVAFRIGKADITNTSPDSSLLTPDLKSRIPGEVMALVTRSQTLSSSQY